METKIKVTGLEVMSQEEKIVKKDGDDETTTHTYKLENDFDVKITIKSPSKLEIANGEVFDIHLGSEQSKLTEFEDEKPAKEKKPKGKKKGAK